MAASVFQGVVPEPRVLRGVPLKDYTTMRVGGPADYLIEPASEEEIIGVYERAKQEGLPVLVLGNGSNLLVSDAGFRGVALHIGKAFSEISVHDHKIAAQAGALLSAVSRAAADHALNGLEFASGIPGSVGGAVYMNAGAYGGEISQVLETARVWIDGRIETWKKNDFHFGYRHSALMDKDALVSSAEFSLAPGDPEAIQGLMNDLNGRRRDKQPLQYPSCGSFFKRPQGYYAGKLVQDARLKGLTVGGAQVSTLHSGFVINIGGATAADIISLMHLVQARVKEQFGVDLEPEVRIIGVEEGESDSLA